MTIDTIIVITTLILLDLGKRTKIVIMTFCIVSFLFGLILLIPGCVYNEPKELSVGTSLMSQGCLPWLIVILVNKLKKYMNTDDESIMLI